MVAKDKFYMSTCTSDDQSCLIRASNQIRVFIDLSEEKQKEVHICLMKNGDEKNDTLRTDKYNKVKAAVKADFDQDYMFFLKILHRLTPDIGEFYFARTNGGCFNGMAWYSQDQKEKAGLITQFWDDSESFSLRAKFVKSWQGIQHYRRANNPASAEQFGLYFKSTLSFLHDTENYSGNYKSFACNFMMIVEGEEPLLETHWAPENMLVIEKLGKRVSLIEKRLIEIDNDSPEDRLKMRGELDGLMFALSCLKTQ